MAYAQWVEIRIYSENMTLTVKNVVQSWGKFYKKGNKDDEISKDKIEGLKIDYDSNVTICSCGRSNSWSGTEGSFELYDGSVLVGKYYWDCPWGSKDNKSEWTKGDSKNYETSIEGGNLDSGAIGNVYLTCIKIN
ncbi:aegerolysin family protein [Pectobacterium carotovorum]|uniref:aegerolysin family protein n=1 Tax=Pectobacterium carotovorum TaxID=554 RepID=UPI0029DCF169|nr:aegerolysin family protein [Pectobacterium carotovorum]MDX6914309.1 aegerolysin family protein [Pectobacterium carotovorum]